MITKVVQLATLPESDRVYPSLFVLDSDGTIWQRPITGDGWAEWRKVQGPPIEETKRAAILAEVERQQEGK